MENDVIETEIGHIPSTGWQALVPELHVNDIIESRAFWCGILGFQVAFERPEEKFVYLERPLKDGRDTQIMLCQRNGRWETGEMGRPFGRGAMFQIAVDDLDPIVTALSERSWPLYAPIQDAWRRTGARQTGQRELFVLDPDGYLLMLNQSLGERPLYDLG